MRHWRNSQITIDRACVVVMIALGFLITGAAAAQSPPGPDEMWQLIQEQQRKMEELERRLEATGKTVEQNEMAVEAVAEAAQEQTGGDGWWQRTSLGGYPTVHGWVTRVGDVLLIDEKQVSEDVAPLVGAVASADGIVVATAQELFIHTADGHLVERLHSTGLPGHLDAVGLTSAGSTAVRSARGVYAADRDLLTWRLTEEPIDWARSGPLPTSERDRVLRAYHGGGLPWSRILLDVHTGRIFGSWGSIVMDVVAVALLVLAGTGLLNWRAHRRRMRRARAVNRTTASAPQTEAKGDGRRPLSTGLNTDKPPVP